MARRGNPRGVEYNTRRDSAVRRVKRMYIILGIVVVLSTVISMIIQNGVHTKTSMQMGKSVQTVQTFMIIQDDFDNVNKNVLLLIASLETSNSQSIAEDAIAKINSDFSEIDGQIRKIGEINGNSDSAMRANFNNVVTAIQDYRAKINEISERLGTLTPEQGMTIYREELEPVQITAANMLQATIVSGEETSKQNTAMAQKIRGIIQGVLIVVLIGIIVLVVVIGKRQISTIAEIRRKEQEITEAGNRLTKSKKKLVDSAMTNILTGLKNRYGLDESLSQLLGNAPFNIAVFDIDNFRLFNDMYGYEFGDEYLATVAEMLKNTYADYAEMFNITGNEFCAVFYDHVSDIQAQQLAEQIRQAIGQPMNVAGILVQATVSSSLYHCLPSDNLEVNTLLMKMDSVLHAAKRDGGNRLYQVQ